MTKATESPHWFTSSYSSNGGDCVEVAASFAVSHGVVPVRDSKRRDDGRVVAFPAAAWSAFVTALKR
ncbi:hypothetical protein SUDANB171_02304 [Streptomyces sp. enrichment culture]|uniref:DUF397 domain-containing protein n=1 Tax=Streptomyces sp. enrichment culture TaxID=1795815 RepID=UPI003F5565E3